ncbi:hypothetical protein HF086_014481 [Spodoptera exigua]|uniref:Uncharacterized protein n=1 Tax=Spodoptera exigua TaxID=7107 RepID=A0A922SJS2_SPOEX|nr:hypothetical protein HF086_014481 [Spodoptera exigua]
MDSARTERRKPRKLMKVDEGLSLSEYVRNNKKYWNDVFNQLDTYHGSVENESKMLAEVLPKDLYEKVLNLPRRIVKEPQISTRKCLDKEEKSNIYLDMLNKPIREQITWPTRYLQPEREDEKSLVKKADDLTDRIANEFCEYMKQLGGDQQSKLFTPKAIKELFQSLCVVPKELPCVEDKIANITGNPTVMYCTWSFLLLHHEQKFSTSSRLDFNLHTRSVKEYCRWMIHHPEHRRPPYLKSLGLFDPVVLDARLTFESEYQITPPISSPHDPPAPIENMRTGFSESINHE